MRKMPLGSVCEIGLVFFSKKQKQQCTGKVGKQQHIFTADALLSFKLANRRPKCNKEKLSYRKFYVNKKTSTL
jgi:hypothetical protein